MKTENDEPRYMNRFMVTATLPGGKTVSCTVYACDKHGAKVAFWHCDPHAIIESVESF